MNNPGIISPGPSPYYELFGYNPIADAVGQWKYEEGYIKEPPKLVEKKASKEELVEAPKKEQFLSEWQSYIPKIKMGSKPKVSQERLAALQEDARTANDPEEAFFAYKRICEMTISQSEAWKKLLSIAQSQYKEIVPTLCAQILRYVKQKELRNEAKVVLLSGRSLTQSA